MGSRIERLRGVLFDIADRPPLRALRVRQVGDLSGVGLEIGVGTGNNLPHYTSAVLDLTVLDAAAGMRGRVESRLLRAAPPVRWVTGRAEALPFADGHFDFVVSTLLLCGVADPARVLSEVRRVLKLGGEYRFLEHGAHRDRRTRAWQRRLDPVQRLVAGCELTRDIGRYLADSPLTVRTIRTQDVFGGPGRLFPLTGGVAVAR